MPPQISIVLPVRNASKFIGECIESILLQTFTNFEVVVVNDGSTDESIEIINSFRSYKIRILQNKGKGISDALNWGIKHTIGALICRMDADDICYPSRLELQYDKFRTDDKIDIVCTRVKYGSTIEESVPLDSITQHEDIKYFLLFQNPIVHSSVMFRKKSLLSKSLLYDSNYNGSEDYELWCRCMIYGLKFLILDSYELFYRVHSGQSSLEGNQLLKNLLIKANYGNSVPGKSLLRFCG